MSDAQTTPETAPAPVQETAATTSQAPVETFNLEYVQQLRSEAAKYRTEKNDAVNAAKLAASTEWESKLAAEQTRYNELSIKLGGYDTELTKIKTAIEAGVPSDKVLAFAGILQGSSEDEIKSAAESAKALFGGLGTADLATDPTQGTGGHAGSSPAEQFAQLIRAARK